MNDVGSFLPLVPTLQSVIVVDLRASAARWQRHLLFIKWYDKMAEGKNIASTAMKRTDS